MARVFKRPVRALRGEHELTLVWNEEWDVVSLRVRQVDYDTDPEAELFLGVDALKQLEEASASLRQRLQKPETVESEQEASDVAEVRDSLRMARDAILASYDPGSRASSELLAGPLATLAVAAELRGLRAELPKALTAALLDALGDDSHLDKLTATIRDLPDSLSGAISGAIWEGLRQRG